MNIKTSKNSKFKLALKIVAISYVATIIGLNLISKYYINTDSTKKLIQEMADKFLGKKLIVEQNITLSFSWNFTPTLVLNNINIEGLIKAKQIEVSVNAWPLLFKEFYVKNLTVKDFAITIKNNNPDNKSKTSEDSANYQFMLDHIKFSNGTVTILDNGKTKTIKINDLSLDNDDLEFTGSANLDLMGTNCHGQFIVNMYNSNDIKINIKKFQYDNINIFGKLALKRNPNSLTGELFSDKLIFKANNATSSDKKSSAPAKYTLPTIDIPVAQIAQYKLDLSYRVKELETNMLRLSNLSLNIKQDNNILTINTSANDHKQQGNIALNINYAINLNNPNNSTLALEINATNTKLENIFIDQNNQHMFTNGNFKIASKISSSGDSLQKLVANSRGKFLINSDSTTFTKNVDMNSNPIKMIFNALSQKAKAETNFNCIVVNFKLNNGTANADKGLALESGENGMQGSGLVNLNTGNLNITIDPSNINPGKIDNTTFLNMLQLTGNINNPQIALNPQGVVRQGATAATSLLGGAFGKIIQATVAEATSIKNPCKTALEQ